MKEKVFFYQSTKPDLVLAGHPNELDPKPAPITPANSSQTNAEG